MFDYDLIVIGAGSGGLTAAIGGVGIGAKVLLIEKESKLGGDCTHYGCVPSKTLIKAARVARQIQESHKYGLSFEEKDKNGFDIQTVLKKVQKTVTAIEEHSENSEKLKKKFGFSIEMGDVKFVGRREILLQKKDYKKKITAKKFIIATGARAFIPPIPGLSTVQYMTNKEIFIPKDIQSLTIIGSGAIGSELAQAFVLLGVTVNLIQRGGVILEREDNDVSELMQKQFEKDGIKIYSHVDVVSVRAEGYQKIIHLRNYETHEESEVVSNEILIATGRKPNTDDLDLKKAGIEYSERGIKINTKTQTTNKYVYAVGDVAGGIQFTHFANHQAKVALANSLFHLPQKYETEVIPRVTFTTPEVASVGISERDIPVNLKDDFIILKKEYSSVDRAITDSSETGFYKIITDKKGFIKGATIVGESAGELISEIVLAMKNHISVSRIANTIHAYPTYGYGLKDCAQLFIARSYTEKKKKIIQKILGLRG